MPATPFMQVDFRRDHSLRIPSPDLSIALGVPNACTGCHLDPKKVAPEKRDSLTNYAQWLLAARQGDDEVQREVDRVNHWASDWLRTWYGDRPAQEAETHFAHPMAAAWQGDAHATPQLKELVANREVAAIVRASALTSLAQQDPAQAAPLAIRLLQDADPQLRIAAVMGLEYLPDRERLRNVSLALNDNVRAVRIEAARILAGFPDNAFDPANRVRRKHALVEYRAGLLQNNDQANAHLGLGLLAETQRDLAAAATAYRDAIRVQNDVTGPRSNLAALLEQTGQTDEAKRLRLEELALVERDARLAPDNAWIQYRLGLALHLQSQSEEALQHLERACELAPHEPIFRLGVTLLYQRLQRWSNAESSVQQLRQLVPSDQSYQQLEKQILIRQNP